MQARLVTKLNRPLLRLMPHQNQYYLPQRLLSSSVGRTADPDVHGGDVDDFEAAEAKKAETAKWESEIRPSSTGKVPFSPSKSPCGSSQSPKIESRGVNDPIEPNLQQKRRNSTAPIPPAVSCVGLDGGAWPDDATDRRRQEEDDREYFKHHKASPLSGFKMVDTRKPITRATDGGRGGAAEAVVVWRPEQLETAEETLLRAMEIWKHNAARGDPDSPHGKILRELRGEYW